jgi:hypothetical protein
LIRIPRNGGGLEEGFDGEEIADSKPMKSSGKQLKAIYCRNLEMLQEFFDCFGSPTHSHVYARNDISF